MKLERARVLLAALVIAGCSSSSNGDPNPDPGTGGTRATGGSAARGGGAGGTSASGGSTAAGGSASAGGVSGAGGSGAGGSGGTPGSTGGAGGTSTGDAAGTSDGGSQGETNPPSASCGTTPATFMLDGFGKTEGLVVGPDGTIYFSDFGPHVMRAAPPYTQVEKTWATVAGAQILGIMLDPKRKLIYAGSRSTKMLYTIDTTSPATIKPLVAVEAGFNGITLADDGAVFYTDQGSGHVFRVSADGTKSMVTKTPVKEADGLAFDAKGALYIVPYLKPTPITKLDLTANVESGRSVYATVMGAGSGDGIAFDKDGNMYVTAGGLYRVAAADQKVTTVNAAGGANVEFGVGALSCKELIWAATPPHHQAVDIEGLDVPWHRL
jgi:sugar lactone lactonase YvrE